MADKLQDKGDPPAVSWLGMTIRRVSVDLDYRDIPVLVITSLPILVRDDPPSVPRPRRLSESTRTAG